MARSASASSSARSRAKRGSGAAASEPLLLVNIGQLLTLRSASAEGPRRGAALCDLGILASRSSAAGVAVLCAAGRIVAVGPWRELRRHSLIKKNTRELDCGGRVVLPGFVDSHTHPVFVAPRLLDFEQRVAGRTYEQIAAAGGGIRSSIAAVRGASPSALSALVLRRFEEMLVHGTTTVESKSGYGLTTDSELASLKAIRRAARSWPGTVVATLLGAHVVPGEFRDRPADYVREITERMVPQAAAKKLADFVDVFCERDAFTLEQAEQVFAAAAKHGLGTRAHLGQFSYADLATLLRSGPASFDHMDFVEATQMKLLARSRTVATLLPASNYFLGLRAFPPARQLIDAGVAVALATDFNPGTSPTCSMQFVLSLACTQLKMSPAEAIAAATINGAWALRLAARKGSIEPRKDADLAVFDAEDYRELPYWFGANRCAHVVAGGKIVF